VQDDGRAERIAWAPLDSGAVEVTRDGGKTGIAGRIPFHVPVLTAIAPDGKRIAFLASQPARAADCAATQGVFQPFHRLLFERRDSIGVTSFERYASDAGVHNLAEFSKCAAKTGEDANIEASIAEARRIGGKGTPTVVVNGLRLHGTPDSSRLAQAIERALRRQ
jgi:protein-disulfide isomerase